MGVGDVTPQINDFLLEFCLPQVTCFYKEKSTNAAVSLERLDSMHTLDIKEST